MVQAPIGLALERNDLGGSRASASGADATGREKTIQETAELDKIANALARICSRTRLADCLSAGCPRSTKAACREHLLAACSLVRGLLFQEFVREHARSSSDLPHPPSVEGACAALRSFQAGFSTRLDHLILNLDQDCIARGRDALAALVAEWTQRQRP